MTNDVDIRVLAAYDAGRAAAEAEMLPHYSRALDEVFYLRAVLAHQALTTEGHLSYATFPKRRRELAEHQVGMAARAAAGAGQGTYMEIVSPKQALKRVGAPELLTRAQWEAQEPTDDVRPSREK